MAVKTNPIPIPGSIPSPRDKVSFEDVPLETDSTTPPKYGVGETPSNLESMVKLKVDDGLEGPTKRHWYSCFTCCFSVQSGD